MILESEALISLSISQLLGQPNTLIQSGKSVGPLMTSLRT